MSSKRRRFTPEVRAEAVRLVTGTDRPVAHVAADRAWMLMSGPSSNGFERKY